MLEGREERSSISEIFKQCLIIACVYAGVGGELVGEAFVFPLTGQDNEVQKGEAAG